MTYGIIRLGRPVVPKPFNGTYPSLRLHALFMVTGASVSRIEALSVAFSTPARGSIKE